MSDAMALHVARTAPVKPWPTPVCRAVRGGGCTARGRRGPGSPRVEVTVTLLVARRLGRKRSPALGAVPLRRAEATPSRSGHVFARAWYPVCLTAITDRSKPHHLQICNVPVVFWHDGAHGAVGAWRAARDECPHRRARLSEGRLEDRQLQCPYHGWTFDGTGRCTSIPQADERQKDATESPRACLSMLPTEERNGLLFLWAASLYDDAQPPDLEMLDEMTHEDVFSIDGVKYVDYSRDLFMDLPVLIENVLDPAHLPFTHHDTISKRDKATAVPIQITARDSRGFTGRRFTSAPGTVTYQAPNHVWALTDREDSYRDWNIVYATPMSPGRCRIFVRVVFEVSKIPMPLRQIFQIAFSPDLPAFFTHLSNHKVLEDDNIFLHYQGQTVAPDGKQDPQWRERFYTPTTSDAAVLCYHRWLQDVGGQVVWASPGQIPPLKPSREDLLERFHSHTSHCQSCSEALHLAKDVQSWAQLLFVLGLLTALLLEPLKWPSALLSLLAAGSLGAARELEKQLTVGEYPPPRNR